MRGTPSAKDLARLHQLCRAPSDQPHWQRLLQGDVAKKAADLQGQIDAAEAAGRYGDAVPLLKQLVGLRATQQGPDHWQTVNVLWALESALKLIELPAEHRQARARQWNGCLSRATKSEGRLGAGRAGLARGLSAE